jgi:hydrogenase maturation factor
MSRLYKVLDNDGARAVRVEDVEGTVTRASLLALDGDLPAPGDWVVVHSGYVIDRADRDEAQRIWTEIRGEAKPVSSDEIGVNS